MFKMNCTIKSGTHAATVAKVLSQEEWMDNRDVKMELGWGPNDSASSVLSDMYNRRCPECIERREKRSYSDGAKFEYRLTQDVRYI